MTRDASLIGVFSAEAGQDPPSWHVPIPARRGGPRPNAGRPLGATDPRLTPEATRDALDALRLPGESWAALGRRIGVGRSAVSQALVRGLSVRRIDQWTKATPSP